MDTGTLHAIGKDMGLTGPELREWVEAEHARERDLRAQAREEQREKMELEERRLQAEERVLQLKLKLQEPAAHTNAGVSGRPSSCDASAPAVMDSCSPHKLLPPFNEARDDLDAYLQRFERVAASQEWPRNKWALSLSLCLTGEALSVISRPDAVSAADYDQLKATLLLRFRYTAEGYREKLRKARPEDKETGLQYASRIAGHFDRWIELASVEKTYDALRDIMISEQFMKGCSPSLRVFLKERKCKKLSMLAQNADCYLEAQDLTNLGNDKFYKNTSADSSHNTEPAKPPLKKNTYCFLCNKIGHRASECWSRTRNDRSPTGWSSGRTSSEDDTGRNKEKGQASCMLSTAETTETAVPGKGYVVLRDGEKIPIVNTMSTCMPMVTQIGTLPTAKGFLEGKPVTVLRDTGCNTVVVREALVPKENFTGTKGPVLLLDGTVQYLPEVIVFIDTAFFVGVVRTKCMRNPLYDVVLGNIEGALTADQGVSRKPQQHGAGHADKRVKGADGTAPASGRTVVEDGQRSLENGAMNAQAPKDPSLPPSLTEKRVEFQGERAGVAKESRRRFTSSLPVLQTTAGVIDRATLEKLQRNDSSLRRCYDSVGKAVRIRNRETCYFLSNGILYRRYRLLPGKELKQLVVPVQLRETVLRLAHEGIPTGHQGISRTTERILAEFYWPCVQSETKRYVKSCHVCDLRTSV